MNKAFGFASLVSGFVLVGCATTAAPVAPAAPAPAVSAAAGLKAVGEAGIGDRTVCPVTGEEFVVTERSPKVEHQGKTYYFCCAGCTKSFLKDPAKFLAKPKG